MKPFKVSTTKNVVVKYANRTMVLPDNIQSEIDVYWDYLIKSGKTYKRGEVFTVVEKHVANDTITLLVEKTDYAHYLYCQHIDPLGKHGVHIIHTAALVETQDNYYVFGEMGAHTSRNGTIQLCGGGIDYDDLIGEYFNLNNNITKELEEELGITITDKTRVSYWDEVYFKEGGPTDKMTIVYSVKLHESAQEFYQKYHDFEVDLRARKDEPEFKHIITLKKNIGEIEKFFSQQTCTFDEYMIPLFEKIKQELNTTTN